MKAKSLLTILGVSIIGTAITAGIGISNPENYKLGVGISGVIAGYSAAVAGAICARRDRREEENKLKSINYQI